MSIAIATSKRGPIVANRILALLLISMAFGLSGHILDLLGAQPEHQLWYFSSTDSPFFFGPLVYLYIRQLIDYDFSLDWKVLIHFIPGLLYLVRVYFAMNAIDPITELRSGTSGVALLDVFWPLTKTLSITVYVFWSLYRLKLNRSRLKASLSSIDKMTLTWLKHILYTQFFLTILSWVLVAISISYGISLWIENIYTLGLALILIWIAIKGYQQPEVLTSEVIDTLQKSKTNKRSNLSIEDREHISKQLNKLIAGDKIYLDETISLPKLAIALNRRVQLVSLYLNDVENLNFYDFINKLRIDAACKILKDKTCRLSVIEIAHDVGFGNKSTFNSAFRKHKQMTPTEYRKNAHNSK